MKKITSFVFSMMALVGIAYLALFVISSIFSPQAEHVPFLNDRRVISPKVEHYRPLFKKYARANGLESYTDLIMAMAMQESKGNAADIMQASESLGFPKDTIDDPEKSIEAGTRYFKKALDKSGGNIRLALQSYNFGIGFTDYVKRHGGTFTRKLAKDFSAQKARELGWESYGDPGYADRVLRYYDNEKTKRAWAKKEK